MTQEVHIAIGVRNNEPTAILVMHVDIKDIENDPDYTEGTPIGKYVASGKKIKIFDPEDKEDPYIEGHILKTEYHRPITNKEWRSL